MEIAQYIRLFRKWLWLIIIAAFVAGGIGFVVRSIQPPVYTARATIAIGSFIQAPNPDTSDIYTGVELAQTYSVLATSRNVTQPVVDNLNLEISPEGLSGYIDTRIVTGTALMVISVRYGDPILAADIANEVAQQLINNSPTNLTPEQQSQIDLANEQIARLTEQLDQSRIELERIDEALIRVTDTAEQTRLSERRDALIDQTNQASATIAQFSDTITRLQERTNSVDIVEQARVPTAPSGAGPFNITMLAALVGVVLAGAAILLIEYLDDTIRTTEEAAQTLALPVLGGIPVFGKPKDAYKERLITTLPLLVSLVSEGYRTVRTNLLFSAEMGNKKVFIVTSPGPGEGKSVTTANLAISMALAGMRVLLIDADLRRPRVHEVFNLKNDFGLTTLLYATQQDGIVPMGTDVYVPEKITQCLQDTHVPKLRVITSGFIPENPVEVLGSVLMKRWVENFQNASNIDIVLIDTPPSLAMTDSVILAASTNADVILVVDARRTRRDAAKKVKEQFAGVGTKIRGVVVNRVNPKDEVYYGYGYGYGYYNYYSQGTKQS